MYQKLNPDTVDALQLLYGNAGKCGPVCAADLQADELWENCGQAAELLQRLRSQLGFSHLLNRPEFPSDGVVILQNYQPYTVCYVQTVWEGNAPFYLIRFRNVPENRWLAPTEYRALLEMNSAVIGREAEKVLRTISEVETEFAENNDTLAIREANSRILRQQLCTDELLWYENADADNPDAFPTVDVASVVRNFIRGMQKASAGWFSFPEGSFENCGFSRFDPKRLEITLIMLFVMMQNGDADRTGCDMDVTATDDFVDITMRLHSCTAVPDLMLHPPVPDPTLISEEVLVGKFCTVFGAELIRSEDADSRTAVLRLKKAVPGEYDGAFFAPGLIHEYPVITLMPHSVLLSRIRSYFTE